MTESLTVLVVDDEAMARKRSTRLLSHLGDVEVIGACSDAEEALARVEEGGVDIVLLDIQMPGLSGLDAAGLLPVDGPFVIFATAHPEHALEAFSVGAVDYIVKPIDASRLAAAVERARAWLHRPRRASTRANRLGIATQSGVVLLAPDEISACIFDGQLVTVHAGPRALLTDLSLGDLVQKLPDDRFERVHRRALLNLDHVDVLLPQPSGGYLAKTRDGHEVPVSRQAARRLRRRLGVR